jgi:DNA-binding MarR family transcriptional regulator
LVADDPLSFHSSSFLPSYSYQSIQRSGVHGAWTKDIRRETNIQNQALNKIFKALEARRLIKPVKSVNAKAKKLYMYVVGGWTT